MRKRQFPSRGVLYAVAVVGWYLVSCTEVPVPEGGVASISNVRRPSPALVVGDTMRDSTGVVAPLQVIAFVLPFVLGIAAAVTGGHALGAIERSAGKTVGNFQAVFSIMIGGFAAVISGCMMLSFYVWPMLPSLYTQ